MQNKKFLAVLIVSLMVLGAFPIATCVVSAKTGSRANGDGDLSFATANVITSNDYTRHSTLTGATDAYDFYKIQLNNTVINPPGSAERIIVNATAGWDVATGNTQLGKIRLDIYDPNQYWMENGTRAYGLTDYLQFIAPTSGWFYISIEGQGPQFNYGIRVQKASVQWNGDSNRDAATAVPVSTFPYKHMGSFTNQSDPQDFYKVHLDKVAGNHTDLMMVKLSPPSGTVAVVPEVYYSNNTGVPNWFNSKGGDSIIAPMGNIFTFAPPGSADYFVRIWGFYGTGYYNLTILKVTSTVDNNTNKSTAVSILGPTKKHSDSASGEVAYGIDSQDYFKFTGKIGMHINATLYSKNYSMDMLLPVLYLRLINQSDYEYAEADMMVLRQTADPEAVIEGNLPMNDTYYLIVECKGGAGQYILNLTANTPPEVIAPLSDQMFVWENGTNSSLKLGTVFADFDGDPMTYTAEASAHLGITINQTSSDVTIKPHSGFTGVTCANFTAFDDHGGNGTYNNMCVNVHRINHAPYIKKYFNQTFANGTMMMKVNDVIVNISLADYFGDPDSMDKHWYNMTIDKPDLVTIIPADEFPVTPSHYQSGVLTILGKGKEGTAHVSFNCSDNGFPQLTSPKLNLTITLITGVVKIWSKPGGEIRINEDNQTTVPVGTFFTFKPPVPLNDSIAITASAPANISVVIANGIATIKPAKDWCGQGTIIFTGTSVKTPTATNTSSIKLYVTCIDDAPVIIDWSPKTNVTVGEGNTLIFSVTATDVDTPASLLRYRWYIDGSQVASAVNSFSYTPTYDMAGLHNVTAYVNDTQLETVHMWPIVNVTETNRPPIGVTISEPKNGTNFTKNKDVTFVAPAATDPDKDTLTYTWTDGGVKIGTGTSITTKFSKTGPHTIILTVTDGRGGSKSSEVLVNIKAPKKSSPGFDGVVMFLGLIAAVAIVALFGRRYSK